jgi:hypothetical protein
MWGPRALLRSRGNLTRSLHTFRRSNVLPFLSGNGLSPTEISANMATFLAQCGPEVTFLCDAPRYDVALIKPFIPAALRWHYSVPTFPTEVQFDTFTEELQFELDTLRQHHALDDARALAKNMAKISPTPMNLLKRSLSIDSKPTFWRDFRAAAAKDHFTSPRCAGFGKSFSIDSPFPALGRGLVKGLPC